jgi:hypothetical protein
MTGEQQACLMDTGRPGQRNHASGHKAGNRDVEALGGLRDTLDDVPLGEDAQWLARGGRNHHGLGRIGLAHATEHLTDGKLRQHRQRLPPDQALEPAPRVSMHGDGLST